MCCFLFGLADSFLITRDETAIKNSHTSVYVIHRSDIKFVCLSSYFVCLCVESMWHESSRKGGEPFSLAGNKCTSLSLGLQPERPSALQVELEKWEDVTFPKAAEIRRPISHTHVLFRQRMTDWLSVVWAVTERCISAATGLIKCVWKGSNKKVGVVTNDQVTSSNLLMNGEEDFLPSSHEDFVKQAW